METIQCTVERITFRNDQTGYSILKCRPAKSNAAITVIATMPAVHTGAVLSLEGDWEINPKYGKQFAAKKWEETMPATAEGIEKYLGSGMINGIGPVYAKKIVEKFKGQTLEIIEADPDRLLEIDGIGKKRVEKIKKSWEEQKEIKNVMLFLQGHDISTTHAAKIYKAYGSDSIKVVTENPYKLADDIWGIGFKTADQIAMSLGIEKTRYIRLRSGIIYTLNKLSGDGHCFAKREQLIEEAVKLLDVEPGELEITLDDMLLHGEVVKEDEAIYLQPFYFAETGCAKRLQKLLDAPMGRKVDAEQVVKKVLSTFNITYDDIQVQAIRQAVSSKVMVLTGGPGTGKTTVTLGIISAFKMAGCNILLAAPTGRAAKRMSEATGMEAKTIHRLLEYQPMGGYGKNADYPLDGDVLIVDECSMIDIMLMYNLLKAIPEKMSLILVGDVDQLPSVGAGNVLKDIIASGRVPVVRLEKIFRQAQGSRIIMNAHRINHGQMPDMSNGKDTDFFFVPQPTNEDTAALIVKYCKNNLPKYYHADPVKDIQVLAPMKNGVCGTNNLNHLLQEALNPNRVCIRYGGIEYRLGDKVMQIRNNYNKGVFNGDIGMVSKVNTEDGELDVTFDSLTVTYTSQDLNEIVLAYATTIHKSQGSEFPIVVMPFTMSHFIMLQRNLLYTGVTRAKKVLVMIGEKKAVACAVKNETVAERNTRLAQRLFENG